MVGFCLLVLAGFFAIPAKAFDVMVPPITVMSKTQKTALLNIQTFASVRVDWNRSTDGRELAFSLRTAMRDSFRQHFPNVPYNPNSKGDPKTVNELGRIACRLILRIRQPVSALFVRCELGNLAQSIIRREDLKIIEGVATLGHATAMMNAQIQRLGEAYLNVLRDAKRL